MSPSARTPHRWTLDDIPFDRIERDKVRDDVVLFHLLVASSFVEIDTPLYARTLTVYSDEDPAFVDWVVHGWEHEEVRHGEALRRYVTEVWPEFDWQRAYDAFHADYVPLCGAQVLQPTLGLEMISRCLVEVGTSTYYRMLGACTEEPVLRRITAHIRTDEVHHYQHFLETYQRHREAEGLGRLQVVRAMLNRFAMVRDLDADVASRHVLGGLPPEHPFRHVPARALAQRCSALTRQHYPFGMAARMVLKPLRLAAPLKRPLVALIAATGRWYFTHVGIQGLVQE